MIALMGAVLILGRQQLGFIRSLSLTLKYSLFRCINPCFDSVNRPGHYGAAIAIRLEKNKTVQLSEPILECSRFLEQLENNEELLDRGVFKGMNENLRRFTVDHWQSTSLPSFDLQNIISNRPRRDEWRIASQAIWGKLTKKHLVNLISRKSYNCLFIKLSLVGVMFLSIGR